jgi:putative aldouronate transport system permease protein
LVKTAADKKAYRKKKLTLFKANLPLLILSLPAVILLFCINYMPLYGLQLAFKRWVVTEGITGSPFVGLRNFEYFFKSIYFWRITRNTLGYNIVFIIVLMMSSIVVALLLNEIKNRWLLKYYQTTMIFAQFLSWVIVAFMVYAFLSPKYGILNSILSYVGYDNVNWYTEIKYWPPILVFMNTWKHLGYYSLIFYAGIMGIDYTYYEAAIIDGASKLQMVKKIMVPLLKPYIILLLILQIGRIFYSDFGLFFQIPRNTGLLLPATDVMDYYVFRTLRETNNVELASAAGFYQSVMGFTMVLVTNLIIKKISPENSIL